MAMPSLRIYLCGQNRSENLPDMFASASLFPTEERHLFLTGEKMFQKRISQQEVRF
jgi:hypothetical protein